MPPRPSGTDGRDHSYREVIADRYKRMANFKDSIEKLLMLHVVFVLVKLAWHYVANTLEGVEVPYSTLGLIAGEGLLLIAYKLAKLGNVKESLLMLKVFNLVQAVLSATQILNTWIYHNGTNTDGVPTYKYSNVYIRYVAANYPGYSIESIASTVKAFELFLDLTLATFLVMCTFISHKMIVEKMEMKKDRKNVKTDRKDAQKGGSDDEDSDDDAAVPNAVPLQEDKPKVIKAASRQESRRRHA